MILRFSCILLVGLVFLGCRLQYGTDVEAESLDSMVPNVEMFFFSQQVYQDGNLLLELQAVTSRAYQSRNLRELEGVVFLEYTADGQVAAEGRADRAVFFTDTENVELTGSITVYTRRDGATVIGDYFYWDSEARTISSLLDNLVSVTTDDGEEIAGRGFQADTARRRIEFTRGVEGMIQDE